MAHSGILKSKRLDWKDTEDQKVTDWVLRPAREASTKVEEVGMVPVVKKCCVMKDRDGS